MIPKQYFLSACVIAAILAIASVAQAGCNCSVPPSAMAMPMPQVASGGYGPAAPGAPYVPGGPVGGYYNPAMQPYGGLIATNGPNWAPGGYEPRIGSPAYYYDPTGGQYVVTGNPYYDHFGPGFQRSSIHGHYRFPYYNYRAPWYFPGRAVYNRNTNFAW